MMPTLRQLANERNCVESNDENWYRFINRQDARDFMEDIWVHYKKIGNLHHPSTTVYINQHT